jgi:hypothetical protein
VLGPILSEFVVLYLLFIGDFIHDYFNSKFKTPIILSLVTILASSISFSKEKSFKVRDNKNVEITDVLYSKGKGNLKVLGKLGNTLVLTNPSNTIKYFVKDDKNDFIQFSKQIYHISKDDKFLSHKEYIDSVVKIK